MPVPAPEVPPLRPAALEPCWTRGRLILPPESAGSDRESVVIAAAFKIVRAQFTALADDAERAAAVHQRSIVCLRSVAARIPGSAPAQDELFYLAHVKEFLEAYAKFVQDEWPDLLAKRFAEAMLCFDHTIRQFPKWRAFASDAEAGPLTSGEAAGIPGLTKTMLAALREDEARNLIDPAIASALEVFQAPLQSAIIMREQQSAGPGEESKLYLAHDLLASIENIAKRTAEAVLEIKNGERQIDKTGLADEALALAEHERDEAYIWMTRTLVKLMTSTPALAQNDKFSWLKPIVCLAGH